MAEKRRKTQVAREQAERFATEAAALQKVRSVVNDPETLSNQLLDFVDDSLEFVQSSVADEALPLIPQSPHTAVLQKAGANDETVLPTKVAPKAVTCSPVI